MEIQIVETESELQFCNFEKKVFLLNRTTESSLDARVINIQEITESPLPSSHKFPLLMTEILKKYPDFDYEVITQNPDNFSVTNIIYDRKIIGILCYDFIIKIWIFF